MRGPLAPAFLAHSPFSVKALLEKSPLHLLPLFLAMITIVIRAVIPSWTKRQLQSCLDSELGWGMRRSASEKPSDPGCGLICLTMVIELAGCDARLPGCKSQLWDGSQITLCLYASVSSAVKWREQ